jgi:hypothetical protein
MTDEVHAVILRHIDETGAAAQPADPDPDSDPDSEPGPGPDPAARLVRLFLFAVPQLGDPPGSDPA